MDSPWTDTTRKGKARAAGKEPTHFLISGSSAGGIGALMTKLQTLEGFDPMVVVSG